MLEITKEHPPGVAKKELDALVALFTSKPVGNKSEGRFCSEVEVLFCANFLTSSTRARPATVCMT